MHSIGKSFQPGTVVTGSVSQVWAGIEMATGAGNVAGRLYSSQNLRKWSSIPVQLRGGHRLTVRTIETEDRQLHLPGTAKEEEEKPPRRTIRTPGFLASARQTLQD